MNKQTIITILLALVAVAGLAQEIKKVAATPEDFMEHMALCGYEVYTYDISSLRAPVSGFTIVIREYNQQGMIDEKKLYGFRTKTMISDFNEKDQQEIYVQDKDHDFRFQRERPTGNLCGERCRRHGARHLSPGQDPRCWFLSRSVGLHRDHYPAFFSL